MSSESKKSTVETAYLDNAALQYDRKRFSTKSGLLIDAIEQKVFSDYLSGILVSAKVLELGCGTGRFLEKACEYGFRCEALDASPDMVEQARNRVSPEYPETVFYTSDAANIPVSNDVYDAVYCIRLLNQVGSSQQALAIVREMFRVAKPGGKVLIEFVNFYRLRGRKKSGLNDVYMKASEINELALQVGGNRSGIRGAFFFGMSAYHWAPDILLPFLKLVDDGLCMLAPGLCARCYLEFTVSSLSSDG